MTNPLRIGVAGLGFGAAVHIPGFQALDGVIVTACLGRRPDHTRDIAQQYGVPAPCDDVDTFLDQPLDAVSLALPPDAVAPILERVLKRSLPVLCEKPIANDAVTARRLANLAKDRNIPTAVDFQFRHLPVFQSIKHMLENGDVGTLRSVNLHWHVHSYAHRTGQWSWKNDRTRGGGVMTLLGTHALDMVEWLFGPVERLTARFDHRASQILAPGPETVVAEDSAKILLELATGCTVTLSISNAIPGQTLHRWTIDGDKASIVAENPTTDYMAHFLLTRKIANGLAQVIPTAALPASEDGRLPSFCALAENFINSIRTGTPCAPSLEHGARVQELLSFCRLADKTQTWVTV